MSIHLIIDAGNTYVKAALFNGDAMLFVFSFQRGENWHDKLEGYKPEKVIVSNVGEHFADLYFEEVPTLILNENTPLPIGNDYETPHSLGKDRIAAAVGAWNRFKKNNILIIDAGTCITYDIVNNNGIYLGGIIAPGMYMRLQAMNHFTARLPLPEWDENAPLVGTDTISCMQSGAVNGILSEAEGIIRRMDEKYSDLQVVICGGASSFFESKLNYRIFAAPYLVLEGLNSILIYND
jgi:type III pantothenate kinase